MNIEMLKNTFKKYAENYDMNDKAIMLKYLHSLRVMDLCYNIAQDNNLNKEDTEISILIGLLHDYGRFEQWQNYKTYSDKISIDHADLAVKKLFDDNEIVGYCTNKDYYEIIYDAIKYHNKYLYPDNLKDRNKMFTKIIRDADKLDIFYLMTIKDISLKVDKKIISKSIEEKFYKNESLNYNDINNNNEKILLKFAMIFDLNFDYSFNYIKDNLFIEKIFNQLEEKDRFEPYFEHVKKYVKERTR